MTSTYASELQLGDVTYSLRATTAPKEGLVLDLLGADAAGTVIADGRLRLPVSGGIAVGRLVARVLDAHTRLNGRGKRLPANANQRWSSELDTALRDAWLTASDDSAVERIRALARSMQRSPTAIRARLPRVGCDPDIPGRPLSEEAARVLGVRSGTSQGEA
ncbi:hypothetical protein Lesp02_41060 [Lentzea sp. NBRC 105346]|uniref:hypothetical protein n=1 Tax=Lentzea sp. NBRC 105346 TaxID=3032205 RepID=UPI0024A020A0|nr:hypothetical protein [Lentzea sp. NBRC 105346]GLZ31918.1 hypothetical protein Lesp02_41060 [Lentzea sp. NBRC 105346]